MKKIKGHFSGPSIRRPVQPVPSNKFSKRRITSLQIETPSTVSNTNKMERVSIRPLGAASAAYLRGIKHFQVFKKVGGKLPQNPPP